MKRLLMLAAFGLTALGLARVSFGQQAAATAQRPPVVHSPEVQDARITFRLYSPSAQKVTVSVEGQAKPIEMQKDAQGIWSATTESKPPNLYGYSFTVDGMHVIDPVNTKIKPNLLNLSNEVEVADAEPMPWDQTDIPHGEVHHHFYKSNIVGDERDYFVYTPTGYSAESRRTYPVLYLLHGYSDDASGWTAVGRANLIMDTLIASHRARPMIVVMPLGYGAPEIVSRTPGAFANVREKNMTNFTKALIEEVIPAVERGYKVNTDRNARAIAGLSMGGAESLLTGLNNLNKFSWVGSFSAGGAGDDLEAAFPQAGPEMNQQLHLLWMACGTEDRLIEPNRKMIAWLKGKGVNVTQVETPGMHTWMVWRHNLITFAPLLFRGTENLSTTASARP